MQQILFVAHRFPDFIDHQIAHLIFSGMAKAFPDEILGDAVSCCAVYCDQDEYDPEIFSLLRGCYKRLIGHSESTVRQGIC